jgi:hypothetical protein
MKPGRKPEVISMENMTNISHSQFNRVRVALIHVCSPQGSKVWPYINFDYETRMAEIEQALAGACPGIEFVPLVVMGNPDDEVEKVRDLASRTDGLLVFLLSTNWDLTNLLLPAIGEWKKPSVFVDELYAGSGVFLCHGARTVRDGGQVVMVSSSRFQDVLDIVQCFEELHKPGVTPESFLVEAEAVRKSNFKPPGDLTCANDPVKVADVEEVIERLKSSKILRVVAEKEESYKALGVTIECVTFDEINDTYTDVDREEAGRWAEKWMEEASDIIEPTRGDVRDSAAIYLAMKSLMRERDAQIITVDCLAGFYSGKLPGYPCLGYRQLNDDGSCMGTCEAHVPDALIMLICRYMFNRACFASDPVLDTSTNQIIYAHCVAPTKMLGPDGEVNTFKIRSHAEDNLGASIQSIMPLGYMTTSLGLDPGLKSMVIHQARAVANVDEAKACRTKLAAEVKGDIDKLFREWDRFAWHRLTVYGDVKEPLEKLAGVLGLEVINEA